MHFHGGRFWKWVSVELLKVKSPLCRTFRTSASPADSAITRNMLLNLKLVPKETRVISSPVHWICTSAAVHLHTVKLYRGKQQVRGYRTRRHTARVPVNNASARSEQEAIMPAPRRRFPERTVMKASYTLMMLHHRRTDRLTAHSCSCRLEEMQVQW